MAKRRTKLDRINEAAVKVMGVRGFARATTQEIADLAGVSEGLLYRHYTNKIEMALALFKRHYLEILGELKAEAARHTDPIERVRSVTNRHYEWFDANPDKARFILKTQHDFLDEVPQDEARTLINMMRDTLRQILGGPVSYLFPVDVLSAMILGAFLQVSNECMHGQINGPLAPRMKPVTETFIHIFSRLAPVRSSRKDGRKE